MRVEGGSAIYYTVAGTTNTNPYSVIPGITGTGFYGCP